MTNRTRVRDNNNISQLLRDSFSVSQQPAHLGTSFPLFHETIPACSVQVCGGCCTCGQCGPGQRRGQTPLRHQRPQTWRVGGSTAQLHSTHLSSPSVSPGLLVLGTHVQHDPCEGRPSVCSGARKAVVLLMVKRRSEGSCARVRHTSTHLYIYLQHSMLRLKLDILLIQ